MKTVKTTVLDRDTRRTGEETQEQRESGTETIKVPLGIMQVPDIRYVSKEI